MWSTQVLTSQTLDRLAGVELHFKCEAFQKIGAFKIRGAANAVFALPEDCAQKGVITHSSGVSSFHAQTGLHSPSMLNPWQYPMALFHLA